ncbi:MAG: tRNA-dihydrouridine synthase family protein [Synergistales bacterium]|nr:tRNA-dihydrouridine synthase family protein [Synergistales bacterium]MDY6401604.1 tRNA-dihydrouridine synthase family protein [Synergistales bacterium]MDY6404300.1 tRNA-dihydrouridine synthase family protein [Synergistales bacterium]MDY6410686.1 tRNA-dihydrouridine synthase family protein [Synergistales bacterium]MDY6414001.1 tRNA-dihydrouridine synthase family protein [Synergistales bacterium]
MKIPNTSYLLPPNSYLKLALAPLAGVTTLPVREFFSEHGAELTHTEMISCAGLIRHNEKTFDMLKISPREAPLVIQLFAPDEKILIGGAEKIKKLCKKFFAFGINMACPMPKITKNHCGSALLKKPETAFNMVKELKNFNLPVWVKIRKLENETDTLKFIETLTNAGADNICIHGRTAAQRYEGQADKNIVGLAAKNFPSLISASGDVKTVDDINEYFSYGCVCVMLARGAIANPFLFEEYHGIFRDNYERIEILINFAKRAKELSGEHKALVAMKRFAGSMIKFSQGSAEKRKLACMSTSLDEIIKILRG